jgi:hypothetical protein
LRDPPRRAAPHQQSAQRNDKRRDAQIRDQRAVQQPDCPTRQHRADNGQQPCRRMFESDQIGQQARLQHAHQHPDKTKRGADRQVDIARDDDQNHAARHHRDGCGLHRQVP